MGQYKLKQRGFYYFNSIPALAFVCECVCANVCVPVQPPWCKKKKKRREEAAQTSQPEVTPRKTLKPAVGSSEMCICAWQKETAGGHWKRLLKPHFSFKSVGGQVIGAATRGRLYKLEHHHHHPEQRRIKRNSKFCVCGAYWRGLADGLVPMTTSNTALNRAVKLTACNCTIWHLCLRYESGGRLGEAKCRVSFLWTEP